MGNRLLGQAGLGRNSRKASIKRNLSFPRHSTMSNPSSSLLSYMIPSTPLLFKALNHRCRLRNSPKIACPLFFLLFPLLPATYVAGVRHQGPQPTLHLLKTEPQSPASELGPKNDRAKGFGPILGWFPPLPTRPHWCRDRSHSGLAQVCALFFHLL